MGGRVAKGCGVPSRVRSRKGKGWREDQASGFVRYAEDYVDDLKQGPVDPKLADTTPGFGTYHPQDVKNLPPLDDPHPIHNARPDSDDFTSKQDLRVSDQEVKLAIQEGRAPRLGY